jgi:hypothetical protein
MAVTAERLVTALKLCAGHHREVHVPVTDDDGGGIAEAVATLEIGKLVDKALRHNTTAARIVVDTVTNADAPAASAANTGPIAPLPDLERLRPLLRRLLAERVERGNSIGLGLSIDARERGLRAAS